jgi:thiol-disulfide isomerase/thioredoxin
MKFRTVLYIILFLFTGNIVGSQTLELKKVNIGDTLPDYPLKNILNYPQGSAQFSDFKGKILILDFWESSCKSCIEAWPKLIKLQEKFKDKIRIITINAREDQKRITDLIKQQERLHQYTMTLPVVYGDSDIKQLFPYYSLPHIAFIDENQVVKYIAAGSVVNEITIQNMIDHKQMKMGVKTDIHMDRYKRLYTQSNVGKDDQGQNVLVSTTITPFSYDIDGLATIESYSEKSYGYFGSFSVKDAFRVLFGRGPSVRGAVPNSRVIFKDIDSTKYVRKIDGIVKPENQYAIQVIVNKYLSVDQMKWKMYTELASYFDVRAYWGKQKMISLVISRNKYPINEYKEGESTWMKYDIGTTELRINKISIEYLLELMDLQAKQIKLVGIPIVDETNFKGLLGRIEFISKDKEIDHRILGDILKKNGLEFSFQVREVDVLFISKAIQLPSLTAKF